MLSLQISFLNMFVQYVGCDFERLKAKNTTALLSTVNSDDLSERKAGLPVRTRWKKIMDLER